MRTIQEYAADLAIGKTTSRAIVENALAKIDDKNGEGARTFIKIYPDAALAEADASVRGCRPIALCIAWPCSAQVCRST